jgi:hypothetical protein
MKHMQKTNIHSQEQNLIPYIPQLHTFIILLSKFINLTHLFSFSSSNWNKSIPITHVH